MSSSERDFEARGDTASLSAPHKGAGHRRRLRERFLASGLDGFQDYEVIELLLTLATPRKDCKDSAKAALRRFRTLQGVLEASPEALCRVAGVGPNNLFGLKLIHAVADRYLKKKLIRKDAIHNSTQLRDYLTHRFRDKQREYFAAVYLDAKNQVIDTEVLFEGTLTASSVYPREVVRAALDQHAAAVIFAHNHPSGDPRPSAEDITVTRKLVFACEVVGIRVHEHLVIGDQGSFSFADQGCIARMKREFDNIPIDGTPP
jgi:DNA repair protein RadC